MKQKSPLAACLLFIAVLFTGPANAQFFNYLPGISNYIRSDVKADPSGLTFSYLVQDSTLAIKTILLHTDNNGQVQWTKNAGSNFGSYTIAPDTSVILTGGRTVTSGNRVALLQKTDKNGTVIWKKAIAAASADVGVGNVLVGANNTFYATLTRSSFLSSTYYSRAGVLAFDGNGQILWTKYFANSALTTDYSFSRTLVAANGDFVGVADIRGSSGAAANGMMITRISPQGTIRFSRYVDFKTTHNQLSVTGLVETPSGNLVFGGRLMTDQISTYPNSMWLGRMDSAGTLEQQRVYSGGTDVGEQLHSLRYANGNLFAYLHYYAPFDSIKRSLWIGTLNEQSLAFTAQNATAIEVSPEDPYGNVSNAFCISSNGKPTAAGGFYCAASGKYLSTMEQWSSNLGSSCAALHAVQPLLDSAATYVATNYVPQSSFTVTYAPDTTLIEIENVLLVAVADLCNGCTTPNSIPLPQAGISFHIYPNPSDGHAFINLEQPFNQARVVVSNMLGKVVYQSEMQRLPQPLDLSALAPGIYLVSVYTGNGIVATAKLVKDR